MAAPRGLPDAPLRERLFEEPFRFDFFQAVRLLQRLRADRAGPGGSAPPGREVVRFRTVQGLVFPPSAIAQIDPGSDNQPDRMTVAFLGLTGPLGVLPHSYSELVVDRQRAGDNTLAAFLDLFNHRLISLFYRAWAKYRVAAGAGEPAADAVSDTLLSLVGLGLHALQDRLAVPDIAFRHHAGHYAQQHRNAVGLELVLADYFKLPVEVVQFQGAWLRLARPDQSRLGAQGQFNALGQNAIAGERIWDVQGRFRIRVGPLDWDQFHGFEPGGPRFLAMVDAARLYAGPELDFAIQLVLAAPHVPPCRLGSGENAARLGRSAWLLCRAARDDADDAVFPAPPP